jgi:hypothetical protein
VTEAPELAQLTLRRADAIVLFDWLMSADLNAVPITYPSQTPALADLLTALEHFTDDADGTSDTGLTQDEIDAPASVVAKDMGW